MSESRADKKEKKPNHRPEGWLVTNFHVRLRDDQAKALEALRWRLYEEHGPQDPRSSLKHLMDEAVDLLLKEKAQ